MALNGRKRNTPISLAGSYGADANGRLIVKPQGPVNSGALDKKDAGNDSPWRPSDVTQDEILQQISAPLRAFFEALEPVRPRKARIAVDGDPMGLRSGKHAQRPKVFPTQPTPERVARGKAHGEYLDTRPVKSDAGEELNERITEMVPVLRGLVKRGTIEQTEYIAAMKLCHDWYGSRFRGGGTVQYRERVDGEGQGVTEADYTIACRQRVYSAMRAVDPVLQPSLAWVIATMGDPPPLAKLGEYYAPSKNQQAQSARGADALRFALTILCRHYGLDHPVVRKVESAGRDLVVSLLV